MKRLLLFSCFGFSILSALCILYEVGRAGDSPQATETLPSKGGIPNVVPATVLKGSGEVVEAEVLETGQTLLTVQDEMGDQKKYIVPKGLTVQAAEKEIRPDELQKGDIIDIDYSLSETGDRRVTYFSIVIAAKEKEIRMEGSANGQ